MIIKQADALVIGTGIAGSVCALELARQGQDVILLSKAADPRECNTRYAQGGIVGVGIDDSAAFLAEDILEASAMSSFPPAARVVAEEGPGMVDRILVERLGINFDRDASGDLSRTREAAHSRRRIYHVRDATGLSIQDRLIEAVRNEPRIELLSRHTAVDLITRSHHSKNPDALYGENHCLGAYVFSEEQGQVRTMLARSTVLATGGVGQIYLHTTNPSVATGDGVAMAARAGCPIINAEYVQFHPTALYHRDADRFLITEAARGEGGRLVREDGTPFMIDYDPAGDLAPRDVVARAIHEELSRSGKSCVFLDLARFVPPDLDIAERFPNIYSACKRFGIDITSEPIPVVPAAHYFCGGVKSDLSGRTSVPGLYAVGEVACTGLHGANRLASTSLLEGLVFGVRAAKVIASEPSDADQYFEEIPLWNDGGLVEEQDPVLLNQDWVTVKYTAWNYAGIVRSTKRLTRARSDLNYLASRVEKFYRETRLSRRLIELRNGILTARIITQSAHRNAVSRGCHYRKD